MDTLTHSLCGVLIERWIHPEHLPKFSLRRSSLAVCVANLPDVDLLMRLKGPDAYIYAHRGLTHSLLGFLLIPPLLAWLAKRWVDLDFRACWLLVAACLGSHLCLDVLTSWGTQLLAPFSSTRFALNWVFIIDPVMVLCLMLGVALGRRSGRRYRDRRWGAQWGLGLLTCYLCLAAGSHALAVHRIRDAVRREANLPLPGKPPFASSYLPSPALAGGRIQVEAIPAPLAPLLWNGLAIADTDVVYHYTVNQLRGEAELQATVPLDLEFPLALDFSRSEAGQRYLAWARVPHVQRISTDKILIEDLRYNFKGLEAMARPGVLEVQRAADGALSHRWISQPLPK